MKFSKFALSCVVPVITLLCTAGGTTAAPTSHVGTSVQIDYDPETFVFESNPGGGASVITLSPTDFTVNTVGDSAQIDLRSNLYVSANSLTTFNPEDSFGSYLANFGFSPLPGSIITGYEITFSGIYNIERPGSVAVAGPSTFYYDQSLGAFNAPWSHSQTFMETPIPALSGTTQASAFVDLIDIPGVIVGYEQMPDPGDLDCVGGFDDGFCQLIDDFSRPIYNPPPRTETDFGDANLVINTMTITARTVPEPNHLGFVVIMLAANGWMARRRST